MILTQAQRLEAIQRPKQILDLKGLLMHSYHGAQDPNAVLGSDGHTLIKRAGHGIDAFLERYLMPMLEHTAPIDIVAVLEGGNDVRTAIYPEYKAKRKAQKKEQDPRLTEQLNLLLTEGQRLLTYLGCTLIHVPKVEADDVIAMIAHRYKGPVAIHTRDMDLAALAVLPNVSVMWMENLVDPEVPLEIKNADKSITLLAPRHITLYKTLVGDKTDEYPGVKGLGAKAWEHLVREYGDDGLAIIERCIAHNEPKDINEEIDNSGDNVLRKIVEQWEQARMCYRLALLHPDWCWMSWGGKLLRPQYEKRLPLASKVMECLDRLGVGALYDSLKPWLSTETLLDANRLTDRMWAHLERNIEESPAIGFDTEGYDAVNHAPFREAAGDPDWVDQIGQELTGGSFTFGKNLQHTVYIPTLHRDTANVTNADLGLFLTKVQERRKLLIAHNARFEQGIIERGCGLDLPDMEDTMTYCSYFNETLMEGANGGGGLKGLSLEFLRHEQVEFKALLEACGAQDMRGVSGDEVLHYGCDDALCAAHLWVLFSFAVCLEQQVQFVQENDVLVGKALNRSYFAGMEVDLEEITRQRAADKELVVERMRFIRSELEKHCSDVADEERLLRATKFLEADREFHEMDIRAKNEGCGAERLKSEMQTRLFRMKDSVNYEPWREELRPVEFVPTPKQIHQVAMNLGLPPDEEYVMTSVSGKKLVSWLLVVRDLAYNSDIEFEPEIVEFMELLGAASSQISKRQGTEYEIFAAFCQGVAQRHAPKFWTGDELNFDSPPQSQALLYLKLGLPVRVRSKVSRKSARDRWRLPGSPATNDKAVQMAIAEDCPEGDWRREVLKAINLVKGALTREELFWRPYPLWVRPETGRVHGSIKNNGTITRRPTGSQPNILQVAKGAVRKMIVPHKCDVRIAKYNRHVVVSIDFSGQELRITGSEAKDPSFIDAYTGSGTYEDEFGMTRQIVKDVHSVTGAMFAVEVLKRELDNSLLTHLELDEFGKMSYHQFRAIIQDGVLALSQLDLAEKDSQAIVKAVNKVRKMAKTVNFLICYLGQPSTLAGNIGIPKSFAEQIMAAVFASYGRLAPWQEETIALARKQGYVTTAYGTWKHVSDEILSKDGGLRSRAERQAVNQTVQGCAADILKVVLSESERRGVFHNPVKAVLYAPVYDEVVASVHMDYAFEYCQVMQDIMNVTPPGHAIPMMGEVSIGLNWADQEELGDRPAERKLINLFEEWVKAA